MPIVRSVVPRTKLRQRHLNVAFHCRTGIRRLERYVEIRRDVLCFHTFNRTPFTRPQRTALHGLSGIRLKAVRIDTKVRTGIDLKILQRQVQSINHHYCFSTQVIVVITAQ